uniref:Uncharacterized protein n=1 Tax=Strigamia maritima TaxID=126957 RepID=T1J2S0_STRMM
MIINGIRGLATIDDLFRVHSEGNKEKLQNTKEELHLGIGLMVVAVKNTFKAQLALNSIFGLRQTNKLKKYLFLVYFVSKIGFFSNIYNRKIKRLWEIQFLIKLN